MSAAQKPPMRRPSGPAVLAVLFAIFALNAWSQVVMALLGHSSDPVVLTLLQVAVGASAAAAAWGSWHVTRWASPAALGYGVVTAAMLIVLGPLLGLPMESRRGIWVGAAGVLLFGAWAGWYLRRTAQHPWSTR